MWSPRAAIAYPARTGGSLWGVPSCAWPSRRRTQRCRFRACVILTGWAGSGHDEMTGDQCDRLHRGSSFHPVRLGLAGAAGTGCSTRHRTSPTKGRGCPLAPLGIPRVARRGVRRERGHVLSAWVTSTRRLRFRCFGRCTRDELRDVARTVATPRRPERLARTIGHVGAALCVWQEVVWSSTMCR